MRALHFQKYLAMGTEGAGCLAVSAGLPGPDCNLREAVFDCGEGCEASGPLRHIPPTLLHPLALSGAFRYLGPQDTLP